MAEKPVVLATAKMTILNCEIDAVYKMENGKHRFVVLGNSPDFEDSKQWLTIDELLENMNRYMPAGSNPDEATEKENIIKALPTGTGTGTDADAELLNSIEFRLKCAYLAGVLDDTKGSQTYNEYAFSIEMRTGDAFQGWIAGITSVSFAIYNTEKPEVLKKMGIAEARKLLDYTSKTT